MLSVPIYRNHPKNFYLNVVETLVPEMKGKTVVTEETKNRDHCSFKLLKTAIQK